MIGWRSTRLSTLGGDTVSSDGSEKTLVEEYTVPGSKHEYINSTPGNLLSARQHRAESRDCFKIQTQFTASKQRMFSAIFFWHYRDGQLHRIATGLLRSCELSSFKCLIWSRPRWLGLRCVIWMVSVYCFIRHVLYCHSFFTIRSPNHSSFTGIKHFHKIPMESPLRGR